MLPRLIVTLSRFLNYVLCVRLPGKIIKPWAWTWAYYVAGCSFVEIIFDQWTNWRLLIVWTFNKIPCCLVQPLGYDLSILKRLACSLACRLPWVRKGSCSSNTWRFCAAILISIPLVSDHILRQIRIRRWSILAIHLVPTTLSPLHEWRSTRMRDSIRMWATKGIDKLGSQYLQKLTVQNSTKLIYSSSAYWRVSKIAALASLIRWLLGASWSFDSPQFSDHFVSTN